MSATQQSISVQTVDLEKEYRTGSLNYPALRGVSLSIARGEFVAIVGPSGSGKTTLLNLLGTLDRPSHGDVFIDGVPVAGLKGSQLSEFRNQKLGFVFQSYNLVPGLTALQNVQLPLLPAGVASDERAERGGEVLTQLGLGDKMDKKPNALSGGEQQRVAIARSLVNKPTLVLADEPTGNLDSVSAQGVASLLGRVSNERNVTVVMVTHNMEITKYCRRIIHLRDGRIEREETASQ